MRTLPFYQVDAFADRPFAGNPLAVFPDAEGLTAAGPPAAYMARAGVLPPDEERVVLQGRQIGVRASSRSPSRGRPGGSRTCASAGACSRSFAGSCSSRTTAWKSY